MEQYQRAIQDFDEAIRLLKILGLDPELVDAYLNRGIAYNELQQYQRAIQDFDEAIRLDPQYVAGYATRALAYTFLGKDMEARTDVDRAIQLGFNGRELLEQAIEEIKDQR